MRVQILFSAFYELARFLSEPWWRQSLKMLKVLGNSVFCIWHSVIAFTAKWHPLLHHHPHHSLASSPPSLTIMLIVIIIIFILNHHCHHHTHHHHQFLPPPPVLKFAKSIKGSCQEAEMLLPSTLFCRLLSATLVSDWRDTRVTARRRENICTPK